MNISEEKFSLLESNAEVLKIMGHAIRLAIIELLSENEKMTVTELFNEIGIEQAVASHHLRLLKSVGLVSLTKSGKHSYYYINNPVAKDIHLLLSKK